ERPPSFIYASIARCRFGASKVSNCSVVTGSCDGSAPRCRVMRSRSGLSVLAEAAICLTNSAKTDANRSGGSCSSMPPDYRPIQTISNSPSASLEPLLWDAQTSQPCDAGGTGRMSDGNANALALDPGRPGEPGSADGSP